MKTTVKGEIDRFEAVYTGHGIPREILCSWLEDVDAYVAAEILLIEDFSAEYSYESTPDTELLVSDAPYRRMYYLYLSAMADFTLKQFNTYSSELGEYNRTVADYRHFIVSRYSPASKKAAAECGYYISPYEIAKKHGFEGDEAEWIQMITGAEKISLPTRTQLTFSDDYIGVDASFFRSDTNIVAHLTLYDLAAGAEFYYAENIRTRLGASTLESIVGEAERLYESLPAEWTGCGCVCGSVMIKVKIIRASGELSISFEDLLGPMAQVPHELELYIPLYPVA